MGPGVDVEAQKTGYHAKNRTPVVQHVVFFIPSQKSGITNSVELSTTREATSVATR
jgi:hypothetical protein